MEGHCSDPVCRRLSLPAGLYLPQADSANGFFPKTSSLDNQQIWNENRRDAIDSYTQDGPK